MQFGITDGTDLELMALIPSSRPLVVRVVEEGRLRASDTSGRRGHGFSASPCLVRCYERVRRGIISFWEVLMETLLWRFQRLKSSEYGLIRDLMDKGVADGPKIHRIIEQVGVDRLTMARKRFDFVQSIPLDTEITQKIALSLNYYAMYQAARTAVFHPLREDVDHHERLATHIGSIFGKDDEDRITFWRKVRNEVDYSPYPKLDRPLAKLSKESILETGYFIDKVIDYLRKRGIQL